MTAAARSAAVLALFLALEVLLMRVAWPAGVLVGLAGATGATIVGGLRVQRTAAAAPRMGLAEAELVAGPPAPIVRAPSPAHLPVPPAAAPVPAPAEAA